MAFDLLGSHTESRLAIGSSSCPFKEAWVHRGQIVRGQSVNGPSSKAVAPRQAISMVG